ncbi:hypothetical protein HC174_04275 [Salinimicrobium sp. CDJ15-81-2]|nr:hypothetical protein [Salinimicrobium nanhaiense]
MLWACRTGEPQPEKDYSLLEKNGIFREQFDSTNLADSRYTDNNLVFKSGTRFLYSFRHISKEGEEFYFRFVPTSDNHFNSWVFVPADSVSDKSIQQVQITVKPGLEPMIHNSPDYDQTVIKFEYPLENGRSEFASHTGVIENEKNIWMHPPRNQYFRILELNPFPFIKAPYEVGSQWQWELEIGSFWGDERWKTWEGSITNKYEYAITGKRTENTIFGALKVYEISSTANSSIGETGLTALFNEEYGFIELDYRNIDGSRTVLELVEHERI